MCICFSLSYVALSNYFETDVRHKHTDVLRMVLEDIAIGTDTNCIIAIGCFTSPHVDGATDLCCDRFCLLDSCRICRIISDGLVRGFLL